jgi:hypothetical protein
MTRWKPMALRSEPWKALARDVERGTFSRGRTRPILRAGSPHPRPGGEPSLGQQPTHLGGITMDFNAAIVAHKKWKDRIRHSHDSGEKLDVTTLGRDDQCELGRWLRTVPTDVRSLAEFRAVTAAHTEFHRIAAETVRRLEGASKVEAETMLGWSGPFGKASSACVSALTALRDKTAK